MAEIEHLLPVKNQLQLPVVNAILTGRGCSIFAIRFTVYRGIRIQRVAMSQLKETRTGPAGPPRSSVYLNSSRLPGKEGGGGEEEARSEGNGRTDGRTDADVRGC